MTKPKEISSKSLPQTVQCEVMDLIDVTKVELVLKDGSQKTLEWNTASEVEMEVQISEGESVQQVIKGVLKAQKRAEDVITGVKLTFKDNSCAPEVLKALQGGSITLSEGDTGTFKKYSAPAAGEKIAQPKFDVNIYTDEYDEAGDFVKQIKWTFPNGKGKPIKPSFKDNEFFVAEYEIMTAPSAGQSPYEITVVE
ncbi:hypothetical protein UT300013_32910 [Paraclostridium sordellii]